MRNFFYFFLFLFTVGCFSQNKLAVFFDFNKDFPNEDSLLKINQWVLDNKAAEVTKLLGFCDSVDNSKYNKDLAMRRVNSMVEILNKNNIKIADKVVLKSFGENFKYSKNQSENRKVEVFYMLINDKNLDSKKSQTTTQSAFEKKQIKETKTTEAIETETYSDEIIDMDAIVEKERATLESKFEKAKKGDLIRINNINFQFNSEKIMEQSLPLLEKLLDIMLNNPKLVIEIHGHICCNPNPMDTKLSYRRALVIFKYLQKYQIPLYRIAYKGYGSNDPIYRLPERSEKERAANRRVEILIVDK